MASTVIELSPRDLFCIRPDTPASEALDRLRRLSLHGAPVIDDQGRPIGVVTMMDLVGRLDGVAVAQRMSHPVEVVAGHTPIAEVARSLAECGRHHVVVVDDDKAVGFVSSLDLLAAVVGVSPRRPVGFPNGLDELGLRWSEPRAFEGDAVSDAPTEGGVFLLIHGGAFRTERVVWTEAVANLRARLSDLADSPSRRPAEVAGFFDWGSLRSCVAVVPDRDARARAGDALQTWRAMDGSAAVHRLLGHRRVEV